MPRYNNLYYPSNPHHGVYENITSINDLPANDIERVKEWLENEEWRNADNGLLIVCTREHEEGHRHEIEGITRIRISGMGVLVIE